MKKGLSFFHHHFCKKEKLSQYQWSSCFNFYTDMNISIKGATDICVGRAATELTPFNGILKYKVELTEWQ